MEIDPDKGRRRLPIEGRSSNHFEMAFTESDFLLDFGQAYDSDVDPLIHTRIIMTPRTVWKMSLMLRDLLEKYQQTIGPVTEGKP